MDKQNNSATENKTVIFVPHLEQLLFDLLYDRYISYTDTDQLIENMGVENLEVFLYETAKFFYSCRATKTD